MKGHFAAFVIAIALGPGCRCGHKEKVPRMDTPAATSVGSAEPEGTLSKVRCRPDPTFPARLDVPEASGATFLSFAPGRTDLLVVSDSGNDGAAVLVDVTADAAPAQRALTLALDREGSDDIEGIASRKGALYTLTSSGSVRRFVTGATHAPTLVAEGRAYAIGAPPFSCKPHDVNCGKNWEGLCLRGASVPGRCAGYAASKQENALYCVNVVDEERAPKLAIDTVKPPLKLALPARALADCAFGAEGGAAERVLVVTTNVHGGSRTYVVDEATAGLERIDVPGHVSNEAVAIDAAGALYQLMDDNHTPSASSRFVCEGW